MDLFGRKRIAQLEEQLKTMTELQEALRKQLEELQAAPAVDRYAKRRRPRWVTAVAAVWIAALAFIAGGVVPHYGGPRLEPNGGCVTTEMSGVVSGVKQSKLQRLTNALRDCGVYGKGL